MGTQFPRRPIGEARRTKSLRISASQEISTKEEALESKDLLELIQYGREGRSLEFKRSTPWTDKLFKERIVKSILAFANVRDGGRIIVGVKEESGSYVAEGVDQDHLATWEYDHLSRLVAEFAAPYAEFALDKCVLGDKSYIVITVKEFAEMPVLCQRDGKSQGSVLRRGAIYTRTHSCPESSEVRSDSDLRDILELAVEKGLRRFLQTAQRIGLPSPEQQSDEDRFNEELEGF